MPYDRTWARQVYDAHEMMHARVHQINMCIQQQIVYLDGTHPMIAEIVGILLDSIQAKHNKTLWPRYKRLVRRTPLDAPLLKVVSAQLQVNLIDDANQFELDFGT